MDIEKESEEAVMVVKYTCGALWWYKKKRGSASCGFRIGHSSLLGARAKPSGRDIRRIVEIRKVRAFGPHVVSSSSFAPTPLQFSSESIAPQSRTDTRRRAQSMPVSASRRRRSAGESVRFRREK